MARDASGKTPGLSGAISMAAVVLLTLFGFWLWRAPEPPVPGTIRVESVRDTETVSSESEQPPFLEHQAPGEVRDDVVEPWRKMPDPDTIPATGSVLFIVRDAAGYLQPDVEIALESGAHTGSLREVTGLEGEALFEDLVDGAYLYRVTSPGQPALRSVRPMLLSDGAALREEIRLPDSDLSIRGRVVDETGVPLRGVEVSAGPPAGYDLVRSAASAVSDEAGLFSVADLAEGEYELTTRETPTHRMGRIRVRAGANAVVLVVPERGQLRLEGKVMNQEGLALSGVHVVVLEEGPGALPVEHTTTDGAGRFALTAGSGLRALRFRHVGYRDEIVPVEPGSGDSWQQDVWMTAIGGVIRLMGTVYEEGGNTVANQVLHLYSREQSARYRAQSDGNGLFEFPEVVPSQDYRLWLRPRSGYLDYIRERLALVSASESYDVVLSALESGTLAGRITDSEGLPLAHLTLMVYSDSARARSLEVTSDDDGAFRLADVPAGVVTIRTRSSPQLLVKDVELVAGETRHVDILFDRGDATLSGEVRDAAGIPVGGAKVRLYATVPRGSMLHTTVSDENGAFRFEELGAGPHRLDVQAGGFRRFTQSLQRDLDLIRVTLQPR